MQNRLLRINLTDATARTEEIPEAYLRDYLGGAGLAARYLYDEISPGCKAFSEGNKLFFSVGPLNGGVFPTSGRCNVSCLSPLTGIWLDSSSSGKFGYHLRRAGYLALVVEGKSESPVYITIDNDRVDIKDASSIWGCTVSEAIERIKKETGLPRASVCAIGPSGEKLVKYASIINDGRRATGRGGAGAVMGFKNLKAILVSGTNNIDFANKEHWQEIVKDYSIRLVENPISKSMKSFGTAGVMAIAKHTGDAPTKNWQLGTWEGYKKISGPTMAKTILKEHRPECHACPIQCARYVEIKEGPYQMVGSGPEYETLGSFGSLCLNDNLESIAFINLLCNENGVDTISAGSAVAFALEAYEKGIITREDTGGIELNWGDSEAIIALLKQILNREGLGDILAQGVRQAAEIIGQGAEEFAIHVKGLELPMHDPRAFFSFGPTYATSPRGACHMHGSSGVWDGRAALPEAGINEVQDPHLNTGKGLLAKAAQDYSNAIHSSIICIFTTYELAPSDLARAISAATGYDYQASDVLKIGERVFNLQRAFNYRFGITGKDDVLPKRILTSVIGGPTEGLVPNLEEQLREYYEARGWDQDGKPTQGKLQELGLDFVIKDLYS